MKKYFFVLILVVFAATPTFAKAQAVNLKTIQQKIWTVKAQVEILKISVQSFLSRTQNKNLIASVIAPAIPMQPAKAEGSSVILASVPASAPTAVSDPAPALAPAPERQSDTPVQNPNITKLSFTTNPQTIGTGENFISNVMTVQSQNSSGSSEKAGSIIHLSFNSTSGTGLFASGPSCNNFLASPGISISTGDASRSFCYKDPTPGKPTITVSATGYPAWAPAIQNIQILNGKRGDVNSDGVIDCKDYDAINKGFLGQNSGAAPTWGDGDMNGDGIVNFDDYNILNEAFLEANPGANCAAN